MIKTLSIEYQQNMLLLKRRNGKLGQYLVSFLYIVKDRDLVKFELKQIFSA